MARRGKAVTGPLTLKGFAMGWTYKQRKLRDDLRKQWTEETGRVDYGDPAFWEWAKSRILEV